MTTRSAEEGGHRKRERREGYISNSRIPPFSFGHLPEQTFRPHGQNNGHRRKEREHGDLGEQGLSEVIDKAYEKASHKGPFQTPGTADDDNYKGQKKYIQIDSGIDPDKRPPDYPANARKQGPEAEDPRLGDAKKRGILMEAVTAMVLLLAGANILIMRHPSAIGLVKGMIGELLKP